MRKSSVVGTSGKSIVKREDCSIVDGSNVGTAEATSSSRGTSNSGSTARDVGDVRDVHAIGEFIAVKLKTKSRTATSDSHSVILFREERMRRCLEERNGGRGGICGNLFVAI